MMDPHSRFSHFNSRQTKAGPITSASRYMDQPKPRLVLDDLPTKKGPKTPSTPRRNSSASSTASLYSERPTVTNSRVKQGMLMCFSGLLILLTSGKMSNTGRICISRL